MIKAVVFVIGSLIGISIVFGSAIDTTLTIQKSVIANTPGNVGIGTSTAQTSLAVTSGNVGIGTWTADGGNLIVNGGGNVGIGSAWPGQVLDVNGNVRYNNLIGSLSVYNNGNSGSSATINWNNGNRQKITLTAACTLTFTAPTGMVASMVLKLIQDGTGSWTVTWPGTVKWPGGVAPTLTTTASAYDYVTCFYDGTNYDCTDSEDFK